MVIRSLSFLLVFLFTSNTHAETKIYTAEYSAAISGQEIRYKAIAGETLVSSTKAPATAKYFTYSYLRTNTDANAKRPVTFLFNGGPGSSSIWLHIGGFGPKRISSKPPYKMTDNDESLLDVSDLVFIDAVGTGYSEAIEGTTANVFWGVVPDAKSFAQFIQQWLTQYDRHESPTFILGESYGTLRATLIADELQRVFETSVDGLILLSSVQNYRNIRQPDGSIMGFVSYLPTYAATAWHHKKIAGQYDQLDVFLKEARSFASNEYAAALIKGNRITVEKKQAIFGVTALYGLEFRLSVGEQSENQTPGLFAASIAT